MRRAPIRSSRGGGVAAPSRTVRSGHRPQRTCLASRRTPGRPLGSALVKGLLLEWFAREGRDLPWRRTRDPYAILVSEVMLQQTQVPRVLPRYAEWLERWPTVESLAAATPADVIRAWQGLGYNRRA